MDYQHSAAILQEVQIMAMTWQRPSVLMRPKLLRIAGVEKPWRASYGDVLGKGDSPTEAMENFDQRWLEKKEGKNG